MSDVETPAQRLQAAERVIECLLAVGDARGLDLRSMALLEHAERFQGGWRTGGGFRYLSATSLAVEQVQ